jgi:hypothetical protein
MRQASHAPGGGDEVPSGQADAPRSPARRRLLKRVGGGAALASGGTAAYGVFVEPFHPVLERVAVSIDDLPPAFDGLRIAQLTDLHIQPGFPVGALAPALEIVKRERPDVIVLTGDYANDRVPGRDRYVAECAGALKDLHAPLGVWATFGNHDFPDPPADPDPGPWRAAGIRLLNDEAAPLKRGGDELWLVGLRSSISRPVSPGKVLRLASPRAVKIVLWHEPDRARETATEGGALQLSGHTHGGQVVIPGIGPPVLPVGGRLYPSGLFRVQGMPLYVSRGVGLLPPRLRLNCPPEVTLLTLRRRG